MEGELLSSYPPLCFLPTTLCPQPSALCPQTSAVRTLPGHRIDDVVSYLGGTVNDAQVEIAIVSRGDESPTSDFMSPMFVAIDQAARALNPELTVVPYLGTGATDSAPLRRFGVQAFGVLPYPMEQSDEERMHGNDERISLDSLEFGTRLIHDAIVRVACELQTP